MRPASITTFSIVIWVGASSGRRATVSAISRHQGKHTATGGDAQKTRFEADMDTGIARMMQAMHSPAIPASARLIFWR